MSPEQNVDMARVDERSDLYAAAVVFLEMLTGSPRFAPDRLDAHLAHLTSGIRDLLKKALAQSRDDRFASAQAFREALLQFTATKTPTLNYATTAICANVRCGEANWSEHGYYRGPKLYESTTDTFCGACGGQLKRNCAGCGAAYRDAKHCGDCGAQWYTIPTCETCGSFLQVVDMGTDTKANCCTHGRRKKPKRLAPSPSDEYASSGFGGDDDIPF